MLPQSTAAAGPCYSLPGARTPPCMRLCMCNYHRLVQPHLAKVDAGMASV